MADGGRQDGTQGVGATGERLRPYVPAAALDDLVAGRTSAPVAMDAGLLLVDLEHSTRFFVRLSKGGAAGLDTLQRVLRTWSQQVVAALQISGAEVYQFAGDSILATLSRGPDETDGALARRLAEAAQRVRRAADEVAAELLASTKVEIKSKIGVTQGTVHRLLLGGPETWLHPLLVGPPLTEAVMAEKAARGGEIVVGPSVARWLPSAELGEVREAGAVLPRRAPNDRTPAPYASGPDVSAEAWRLLHPLLLRRLGDAHHAFISELREVTAVFLRLDTGSDDPLACLPVLQEAYTFAQRESLRFDGFLAQTDFTDKGNVLFAVFGAPQAVERQETLAARFAWSMVQNRPSGLQGVQVGIATGTAYCGLIGGQSRLGYTTLGEVAHIAARIMTLGRGSTVHCDEVTARRIMREMSLGLVGDLPLKGVDTPVRVFRIQSSSTLEPGARVVRLVGRDGERATVLQTLDGALSGQGRVMLVVGEAGIGKSSQAHKAVEDALALGYTTVEGASLSFEKFTPFFPWRAPLTELLDLQPTTPRPLRAARVREVVALAAPDAVPWSGLLSAMLGLGGDDEPELRALDARVRRQRLGELVARVLRHAAQRGPLLLVFEDAHWADQASLDLLERVAPQVHDLPVVVLVTSRPGEVSERLGRRAEVAVLELAQLGPAEALALLHTRLRLDPPRPDLDERILARSQGNPFFIESIVQSLRETYGGGGFSSTLRIPQNLDEVAVPDSVQEVVLARVDRLSEADRALLKAASVIGRVFAGDAVAALLPGAGASDALLDSLRRLETLGFLQVESVVPLVGAFRHVLIRDTCYNTLLPSGRRALHLQLATHLEGALGQDAAGMAALLAWHFLEGDDPLRGLHWTLRAAREARDQHAHLDAIHHYQRALELIPRALTGEDAAARTHEARIELAGVQVAAGQYPQAVDVLQEAQKVARSRDTQVDVYEGLGRAWQELGESHLAIEALETTLRLLGGAPPKNLATLGLATVGGVIAFLVGRDPPLARATRSPELRQLNTLMSMIRIYYFLDIARLVWATFTALRLGRKVASGPELSQAWTYLGTTLSGSGVLGPAERACQRGLELAREVGDGVAEGIALSRLGTVNTFANRLEPAIQYQRDAAQVFRRVGEMWEVQTTLMLWATSHFLRGDFAVALPIYDEMGALARSLNARRHQAWRHSWSPMCRYLLGELPAADALRELEEAHQLSESLADLANQCAALNHQANITVREGDAEGAARAAVRAFQAIWRYLVLVPFLQVGLVDAADAAISALEGGATSVPAARLRRIARLGALKAAALGRVYPYLRGPARRVQARQIALSGGDPRPALAEAIALLRASPNRWELGQALLDAARMLPEAREPHAAEARQIFTALGARAELARMDRLRLP